MTNFNMQPVESSNLESLGYDAETSTLRIEFKNGGIYEYEGVPQELFDFFISSESVGKFFFSDIRSQFDGVRVQDDAPNPPILEGGE